MDRIRVALIGGSGIGAMLEKHCRGAVRVPTKFGVLRAREMPLAGSTVWVVNRHGPGHRVPPHRVNYRAVAEGLRRAGCRIAFSSAAVGSLRADWPVETLAIPDDVLDLSGRRPTLYDDIVCHTDFTQPFGPAARKAYLDAAANLGTAVHDGGVYVTGNGPRFETPHEIRWMRQQGGDVVGMTAGTEAILMREAGIAYANASFVTNLGCGLSTTPITDEEVQEVMRRSGKRVLDLMLEAARLALEVVP